MKRQLSVPGAILLFGVMGAGTVAACSQSNNFCLTGAGPNPTVLDGVYISPYTATVNGVSTLVICDDFADEVTVGESWRVTSGKIGSTTNGLFGTENSAGYEEVAWLSDQLLANLSNPTQQGIISYAIWSVFDKTGVTNWLNTYHDSTTLNAVNALLATYNGQTSSDFTVYTPGGFQTCCGPPQEFLVQSVQTAEASAPVILGIDLLGLGVLLIVWRRRRVATR
jgi:hypothetical protein